MNLKIFLALMLPAASSAAEFSLPAVGFSQVLRMQTPDGFLAPDGRPYVGRVYSLEETVEKMRHNISVAPELGIHTAEELGGWIRVATGGDYWHTREALGVLLAENPSPYLREALLHAGKTLQGPTLRAAIYPGAVGETVGLVVRFKNVGTTDLAIIKPVDGSAEGLRYPHYRAWVRRHDEGFVPLQDGRPAGTPARLTDSDIVLLRPGESTDPYRNAAPLGPRRPWRPTRAGWHYLLVKIDFGAKTLEDYRADMAGLSPEAVAKMNLLVDGQISFESVFEIVP